MIKAIALDDERPALDVIEAFCSRLETITSLRLSPGQVKHVFTSKPTRLIWFFWILICQGNQDYNLQKVLTGKQS